MNHHLLIAIAGIVALGVAAQWLAWRLRLPSILLLLLTGFLVGPVTGLLRPQEILGDLLLPVVSLSVALILFEGGLSLKLRELREAGAVIRNLVTVGALATWLLAAGAARLLLGMELSLALLLGAILVVSGPTVILPLLRFIQPAGQVGPILKWEGIVIDPVGATLAVLVFEAILATGPGDRAAVIALGLLKTVAVGGALGATAAGLLYLGLRRYWVPTSLQHAVTVLFVVTAFVGSNMLYHESGLLTVTVMGVVLGNQRSVTVKGILHFGEALNVLLLSALFIILAASLQAADFSVLDARSAAFVAFLILVARPVTVAISTRGSKLSLRERAFLAWMAPRGIVAAAVSSLFALRLVQAGYPGARVIVAITFATIVGTVTVYGLSAGLLARWLGLTKPARKGVLIVGAHPFARALARAAQDEGVPVLLVDNNWANVSAARLEGLPVLFASIASDYAHERIDLSGIGQMLALTPSDEVNSLAVIHLGAGFDRRDVFQIRAGDAGAARDDLADHLRGRLLFGGNVTYHELSQRFEAGGAVKRTPLTDEFRFEDFLRMQGNAAVPLAVVTESGRLAPLAADGGPDPRPGQVLLSLVFTPLAAEGGAR